MSWAEIAFWGSFGLTFYAYVVYPLAIWTLSRCFNDPAALPEDSLDSSVPLPSVTLVIAAYCEERFIVERLNNALAIDYPAERFEILIGCDGEEDSTGRLARAFDDARIRVLQFPKRRGKASVLNDCIAAAS